VALTDSKLTEEEIIKKVLNGNTRAYGELYERYLDEIFRYVYYRAARNRQEAEDLAQTVFVKAWEVIMKNKTKEYHFRGLLYQIARNMAIDRWRTQKETVPLDDIPDDGMEDDSPDPEEHSIQRERTEKLAARIHELEPRMQDVIICRFINELSHAETAKMLGLTEGHVRVLQHRALKKIRYLKDE